MNHPRVDEALDVLRQLGLPARQQNARSALTLLALLDLKPGGRWREAKNPLRGITPMMDFFAEHYGKRYAPNSRETVRRQTVHQFLQASLVVANPDRPDRPTNSGKTVYQITPESLRLLRSYGEASWGRRLEAHLAAHPSRRAGTPYRTRDDAVSVALSPTKRALLSVLCNLGDPGCGSSPNRKDDGLPLVPACGLWARPGRRSCRRSRSVF